MAPGRRSTGRGTATTAITSALLPEPPAAYEGVAVVVMGAGAGIGVAGGAAGVGAVDEVGAEAVEGDVDDAGAVGAVGAVVAVGATAAAAFVGPGEAVDTGTMPGRKSRSWGSRSPRRSSNSLPA